MRRIHINDDSRVGTFSFAYLKIVQEGQVVVVDNAAV